MSSFFSVWPTWWLGDFAGALLLPQLWCSGPTATSIIHATANYRNRIDLSCRHSCRSFCFQSLLQQTTLHDALIFVIILPLLWASLRQGPRDTATVALIVSAFAVWCTAMQCGPFAKPSLNDLFILLLAFTISTAVLSLALSTDVAVRDRTENELDSAPWKPRCYGKPLFTWPWAALLKISFAVAFGEDLPGDGLARWTCLCSDNVNAPLAACFLARFGILSAKS